MEGVSAKGEEVLYGGFGAVDATDADVNAIDASRAWNILNPHWLRRGLLAYWRSNQFEAHDIRQVIIFPFLDFLCF